MLRLDRAGRVRDARGRFASMVRFLNQLLKAELVVRAKAKKMTAVAAPVKRRGRAKRSAVRVEAEDDEEVPVDDDGDMLDPGDEVEWTVDLPYGKKPR